MARSGAFSRLLTDLAHDVAGADPIPVAVAVAVIALLALFAGWRAWRLLYQTRLIEDTPTSKVRSAHQGYVELEGVARLMDGTPTVARLTGLPCCWYRYIIEERITTYNRGRTETRWKVVDRGESTDIFWLDDNTGRVAVDPEGAEITPKHKDVWTSSSGFTRSPFTSEASVTFIQGFLSARPGSNPHRFTEWRINSGDPIFALGLLKSVSSHTAVSTIESETRELLQQWKQDQPTLKSRFDLNKDGQIDEKEWMLARAQARREAAAAQREQAQAFTDGINVLRATDDRSRPYILSAFPQKQLIQRYRWRTVAYGAGFFLLGSVALWLFNARFG